LWWVFVGFRSAQILLSPFLYATLLIHQVSDRRFFRVPRRLFDLAGWAKQQEIISDPTY
jgi:hypothetical protein